MVKAFNNIYAQHLMDLGKPAGTPGRIALPIAGDDKTAKAVVLCVLDELGFDGVDAGGLDDSWRQQPGTPVYTTDFDVAGVKRALSEATEKRAQRITARGPVNLGVPAAPIERVATSSRIRTMCRAFRTLMPGPTARQRFVEHVVEMLRFSDH